MAQGSYTLKIEGLDSLISDFTKAGVNFKPLLQQAMVKSTTLVQNTIKNNIITQGIQVTGNLARSVQKHEVSASRGVVAVDEKYGGAVEFGRKAGKAPPSQAIERWAQLKLGVSGVGFIIARSIGRKGTKANPFVEPAYRRSADPILGYFSEACQIVVRMMAGK